MDLNIIPGVLLLVMLIFSAPVDAGNKSPSYTQDKAVKTTTPLNLSWVDFNEELESKAIFDYITTVFKKVNRQDAQLISKSLVKFGQKYKLDPKFAAALIARESGFDKEAVSVTGAKGLGQIKGFNFSDLGIKNPFDVAQNTKATTQYLKQMITKWGSESEKISLGLASYYNGYTAVKRVKGQVDQKTSNYVNDILAYYNDIKELRVSLD